MRELKIVFQNIKKVCNILLSVNKNVTHKYIKNDPNFISDSHRVKKNTVENMLIFLQWLFQGGEITSKFFSLSIGFPVYSKLSKITYITFVMKK